MGGHSGQKLVEEHSLVIPERQRSVVFDAVAQHVVEVSLIVVSSTERGNFVSVTQDDHVLAVVVVADRDPFSVFGTLETFCVLTAGHDAFEYHARTRTVSTVVGPGEQGNLSPGTERSLDGIGAGILYHFHLGDGMVNVTVILVLEEVDSLAVGVVLDIEPHLGRRVNDVISVVVIWMLSFGFGTEDLYLGPDVLVDDDRTVFTAADVIALLDYQRLRDGGVRRGHGDGVMSGSNRESVTWPC